MPLINPLPVVPVSQNTLNWCWAASGQMIMNYLGNAAVNQCREATEYPHVPPQTIPRTDWCTAMPNTMGFTGWPQFANYGFNATQTPYGVALSWDDLKSEIDNNRPVAFVWEWRGGGGHMMVAIGYETVTGVNKVIINDPSPPFTSSSNHTRSIPYADFVQGSYLGEDYTHWCDFYNIVMTHTGRHGAGAPGAAPGNQTDSSLAAAQAYLPTALQALGPGASPAQASLGPGFAVKAVGLNQLRQLSAPGSSTETVLDSVTTRAFQYPVMLHGSTSTAISTSMSPEGAWSATDGNLSWVQIFSDVRTKHMSANNVPVESYFLVAFNALNLYFLGYKQDNNLFLVPVQDNATLGLVQGQAQAAKTILDKVIKAAVISNTGAPS